MSISSSSSIRRLKDCPVVVDLYEFAPVGGRPAGGRDGRRFERFAEVREDLADRPWLRDERDQPDIAATVWALEGKLLTHPGQQFRPCNPRGVVGAWLVTRSCVVASFRGMTVSLMPAGSRLAPVTDVADGQSRDGGPELVIRGEHPVIAMPVLPRRRDEIRQPIEKLKRREFDDAIGSRPRGRAAATGSDPVGGFVSGQHVADSGCAAV